MKEGAPFFLSSFLSFRPPLKKPESKKKLSAAALSPAAASKAPFLTTRNGLIVDQTGKEVVMKGINWFGWNTNLDATGERLSAFFLAPLVFFPPLAAREKREGSPLDLIHRLSPCFSFLFVFRKLHQRRRRSGAGRGMGHDEGGDDGKRDTFVSPLLEREREKNGDGAERDGKKTQKSREPEETKHHRASTPCASPSASATSPRDASPITTPASAEFPPRTTPRPLPSSRPRPRGRRCCRRRPGAFRPKAAATASKCPSASLPWTSPTSPPSPIRPRGSAMPRCRSWTRGSGSFGTSGC